MMPTREGVTLRWEVIAFDGTTVAKCEFWRDALALAQLNDGRTIFDVNRRERFVRKVETVVNYVLEV
jgi:sugar/nucleoside kinase (ribokinase family)